MFKEDIQPGYAPKEISFMGYTTKNLHHSADAAKAFQSTIAKAHSGSIRQHQLVKDALMHTDQYMKLNDMHLEQSKPPTQKEVQQWVHMHEQARKDLEQLGEFPHHLDYWHMHLHELEAMLANYTPESAGAEMSDSYTPEGNMVQEELTDKTIRSGGRVKVARVIADMLGVENAESMSPDTAVNAGLRKIKNKRMTAEFVATVKKMVQLATEVGIKVDKTAMPTAVSEEAISEDVVNKDSTYNAAKDVMRFNDFAKLSKINKGVVPADVPYSKQGANEETAASDDKTAPEEDETDTLANIPTQVGQTMTHPTNDQLRRRKVQYKLGEWVELAEVSDQTLDKAWHGRYQQATTAKRGSPEWEKAHKSMGKIGDVMKKRTSDKLMHMAKHDPEAYKKSAVASADQDRKRGWSTEEVDLEEDQHSADFKVNPDTGRKYRAKHIEFANSRAGGQPLEGDDEKSDVDYEDKPSKHRKNNSMIKVLPEEHDNEHEDLDLSDAELDKIVNDIDTEEEILDVYDDSELTLVDDETGEEIKEEVSEEALNEVLSRMERMRAKVRFARTSSKRARRLKIVLKSRSSTTKINDRARRLAVKLMKQRLIKKPLAQMTVSEKERAEKIISKRKAVINRLAMKLAPRIRKIENARLSHSKVTK